jgi:hypothetical protein
MYTDLSETELYLIVSITNDENEPLADATEVGPINNFIHSMFSQIQVKFNNIVVENINGTYPYRAYIENTFCHRKESKETSLQRECYYQDQAGLFESRFLKNEAGAGDNPLEVVNEAFLKRRRLLLKAGGLEMIGKPHLNLLNCPFYLLNNVQVNFLFTRSSESFCLLGAPDKKFNIFIKNAVLEIRRVKVNPSVMVDHSMLLQKSTAKYPIRDVIVKTPSIAKGTLITSLSDFRNGQIPSRVIIGLVRSTAFAGKINFNPFNFQHFDLESIELFVSGVSIPHNRSLDFDYASGNYQNAYHILFQGIHDTPNNISYDDYKNGFAIYAFDLTPDLCSENNYNPIQTGSLTFTLKFKNELPNGINAIIYYETNGLVEISNLRKIIVN